MTGISSHSSLGLLCVDESNNILRPDLRPVTKAGACLEGQPHAYCSPMWVASQILKPFDIWSFLWVPMIAQPGDIFPHRPWLELLHRGRIVLEA